MQRCVLFFSHLIPFCWLFTTLLNEERLTGEYGASNLIISSECVYSCFFFYFYYIYFEYARLPPLSILVQKLEWSIRVIGVFGNLIDNMTESMNLTYKTAVLFNGLYGHKFEYIGQVCLNFSKSYHLCYHCAVVGHHLTEGYATLRQQSRLRNRKFSPYL